MSHTVNAVRRTLYSWQCYMMGRKWAVTGQMGRPDAALIRPVGRDVWPMAQPVSKRATRFRPVGGKWAEIQGPSPARGGLGLGRPVDYPAHWQP